MDIGKLAARHIKALNPLCSDTDLERFLGGGLKCTEYHSLWVPRIFVAHAPSTSMAAALVLLNVTAGVSGH
jgi:hypothetical protein